MTTLKDVAEIFNTFETMVALFGATAEARREFNALYEAVGKAIMEEKGITDPAQAVKLSQDTILGDKAQGKFEELDSWVKGTLACMKG